MSSSSSQEPFAVVGYAFKLPQEAEDEAGFWDILETKRNVMTEWPEDRISVDGFGDGGVRRPNMLYARGGHFLKQDPGVFDAPFFSTTATEAAAMDPQQRFALEASYHAFENAGIPVESIRGSDIAVFAATMTDDYTRLMFRDTDTMPRQGAVGTIRAALPNRVSWYFDLRGPSMHIDTACSGSLAALDMACQAMRNGDAKAALVLGANVLLTPDWSFSVGNMNMLSPDSLCYSFDSRANGYSRGEGVVALLVKPLREALQAGDMIRAIIRSTASNQDGQTPTFTQPSPKAQEALIRHAYAKAGLDFGETRYCEAHGTGTQTGDPIEMKAIGSVFQKYRSHEEPLYVGSVKANIGHLEGASGLAGVLKVIMALERGVIPPNALFEKLNKNIDADFFNLQIPTRNIPWPSTGLRRASVNSFGFGGANSHVILDDAYHYLLSHRLHGYHNCSEDGAKVNGTYKTITTNGHTSTPKLLVWSAADRDTIQHMSQAYKDYCVSEMYGNSSKLDQLAYTLAARRSMMSWRSFAVADAAEAASGLSESRPVRSSREKLGVAWVFTGQGAQYLGMGLELMDHYQVFKDSLLKSDDFLAKLGCTWSLFDAINNPDIINRPELSQPLCTVIQIALVDLIRTFGITPKAVVGHSSGEIAAGYAVGALCHESAVKVAYFRGVYAGKLVDMMADAGTPGAMMSVNLTPEQVPAYLEELGLQESQARIACFNSPGNLTLSGQAEALELVKKRLDEKGVFAHLVNTGVAYHSPAVLAVADELLAAAMKSILKPDYTHNRGAQRIPMFSTVSGQVVDLKLVETSRYWVTNLTSPVRFVDALQRMVSVTDGALTDLIEIGPHAALKRPIKDSTPETMRYFSVLERKKSPLRTTLTLLGSLFCHGHPVSVLAGNGQRNDQGSDGLPFLVDCPPYPFNHSNTYWHESRLSKGYRFRSSSPGYLIGRRANDWNPLRPRWRNWLCTETNPWLGHHKISNTTVCPGTGMLIMALEAVKQMAAGSNISGFRIKDAEFLAPIRVGETVQEAVETELELNPVLRAQGKDSAWSEIRIFEHYHDRTTQCFRGLVQVEYEDGSSNPVDGGLEMRLEHEQLSRYVSRAAGRCAKPVDSNAFYNFCEKQGLYYGDAFSQLRDIRWDGRNTSAARIDLTEARKHWEDTDSPLAHPTVLDAAVHLVMAQVSNGLAGEMPTMIPQKLASMWMSAKSWVETTSEVRLSSDVQDQTSSTIDNTVYVLADDGSPLCAIEHLTMARVSKPKDSEVNDKLLYNIVWKPQLSALGADELQKVCEDLVPAALDDGKQLNGESHQMLDDRLQVFLDLASHEIPNLRILEVGAGTGALTRKVLASLRGFERETGQARFSEYVYTDTSADSFEAIRLEFAECQARMVLKTLDIHKDVATEELASYDMIVIGRFLHSTPEPLMALKHVCAFLRPGGHLVLSEVVSPGSSHVNGFAHTENSPPATMEDWDRLLRSTGFTGIELSLEGSTFVSKKNKIVSGHETGQPPGLVLFIDPDSESQRSLAAEIGEQQPGHINVVHISDVGQKDWALSSTDNVVCLLEVGSPRLSSLSEVEFGNLKQLIKDSQRLLWVTAATSQDDTLSKALYAPATGLLRTVRSEDSSKHIVSLAIDSCQAGTEARHVLDVLESCFTAPQQHRRCPERELVVREGHLTIPRIAHEIDLDKERVSRIVPQMRTEPLGAGAHLALKFGTPGMLDTLHYIEDTANNANDDLGPGEVEIEAVAWPISFHIALGRLGDEGLGYECAGFVTRSSSPDLKPGDRVVMVLEGCMCTHPRAPAQNVIKVPDNVPLDDAVAAILPGLTAYHSLVNVARLRRGDTILIHSAAGATGQMAIGVARMLGAEIFATVGFPDKKQFLMDRCGIPEDHIFYSRDTSFAGGIMRMTAGRGVDCVLNCLAGEAVRASFECLAPNGRLIEIGKADIRANSSLAMSGFSMNRTYSGVDMLHLLNTDIALIRQIVHKILELVGDGTSGISSPRPLHLFPASDAERAFRYMQSGKNTGRIIVTASPEDKVQKLLTHRSTWKFDSNASYVVGGGLGGIGRAMVRWMASKGARNLILLSRSGASSEAGCSLLSELEATYPDIQIYAPRCDVSSADDLSAVLQSCSDIMPRIKGCINGIMNLKDSIFEKMTYSQWSATLASKVKASWNLHRFLPADMDFFILLSSLSGIYGAVGQSNYAAGCTFQDALARARTEAGCFGRCSVSLDLGWMRTIGVIAESELSAEYLRNRESSRDSSAVEAEDLIALLEHYCDPSLSPSEIHGSQLLVGAITPAYFLARGEEIVAATLLGNGHLFAGFDVPSAFANGSGSQPTKKEDSAAVLFQQAKDSQSRSTVVVDAIKTRVARAMGVAMDDVDSTKQPSDYGVDSLMAVELRNWIHKTFGVAIAVFEMMGGLTITEVGELVAYRAESRVAA